MGGSKGCNSGASLESEKMGPPEIAMLLATGDHSGLSAAGPIEVPKGVPGVPL